MSTITPTEDKCIETHYYQRRIEFDGAAVESVTGYSHKGKQWIPDTAHARWQHGAPITEIAVYGAILKKDGTIGQQRTEARYVTPAHNGWGTRWNTNAPEWLTELFADSNHTGAAA